MIQAYSKRLLSPFTGQVQIVESTNARALTLGGAEWEIQFKLPHERGGMHSHDTDGKAVRSRYCRVAVIRDAGIERIPPPLGLDAVQIENSIEELAAHLADISLPLPAADLYEFWLLDEKHETPLALIYSCVNEEEMSLFPFRPEWTALSAAMMEVRRTPDELQHYVPPVNYQVQQMVNERAGRKPHASWIRRREGLPTVFPPLLLTEDWEEEQQHQLCQRYIQRQAPRLLMLQGLSQDDRRRLEQAAREEVFEVERFYPLYPDVVDEQLMSNIRVEARLRRSVEAGSG
jgi:hypothetical protein